MKYFWILLGVAVIMVGYVYYALFIAPVQQSTDHTPSEVLSDTEGVEVGLAEPIQGVGTLTTLRLRGENLECAIVYKDENTQSTVEGTYFVSGGDMRGDFLTDAPDLSGQVLSSIIIKENMMYVWSEIEGELYGMKVDLALVEDDSVKTNEPVGLDADVTYDCKPWPNVDRTVFEPPTAVLFQDMSEMLQSGMEYGTLYEDVLVPELPH